MNKTTLSLIAVIFIVLPSFAQSTDPVDWDPKPVMHKVDAAFSTAEAVILDLDVRLECKDEDKKSWTYRTVHRTVKVLDDKGIESFNKMSFPTYEGVDIITLKARTILPDGRVVEITKDKFKTSKGESGSSELVFAMEGVEKNAEIEYIYCYRKPFAIFGSETFQFSIPVVHASFQMASPKRLTFEGKGYNGFPSTHDTTKGQIHYINSSMDNIPAMHNETYSFYDINRAHIDYKVSYLPEEHQNVRVFTWQDLAKRLYENNYQFSAKEISAVDKYLSSLDVKGNDDEFAKVKKIESGIKNNITYYKEIDDENAFRLDNIISKKSATEAGLNRLFAACFKQAGVNAELGITTDRYNNTFDNDFENWASMEIYLFYFPGIKKYLFPTSIFYRCPFLPGNVLTSKGVFCKLTTLGDVTNAIADIRTINPLPVSESINSIDATITFNKDMEANAEITHSFSGYTANGNNVREAVLLLPKDKLKDFVQGIVSVAEKPENLLKYSFANEAFENYYDNKPLQIMATVSAPQLVEKAGPKYIFKIGDIIGRQAELYQSEARRMPIDLSYPHALNRKITVMIPEGYKILNPETINIDATIKDADGKELTAFHSSYTIEGNKLTVTITEFYAQLHFPISDYEPFRKVINASADFNKVNLLMAKQ